MQEQTKPANTQPRTTNSGAQGQSNNRPRSFGNNSSGGQGQNGPRRFERSGPGGAAGGSRGSFRDRNRSNSSNRGGSFGGPRGDSRGGPRPGGRDNRRNNRNAEENSNLDSKVIQVRRITRVVKGGKKMRFSALVVAGDRQGKVGFGLRKGLDYQDAVNKATKKAKENLLKITLDEAGSIAFPSKAKHKAAVIYLKPARSGTGVIAGGFLRPVLDLVGVQNIYSKIIRSNNKIVGIQAIFEALKQYEAK